MVRRKSTVSNTTALRELNEKFAARLVAAHEVIIKLQEAYDARYEALPPEQKAQIEEGTVQRIGECETAAESVGELLLFLKFDAQGEAEDEARISV